VLSGAPGDYVYLANADNTVSVRKITLGPSDGKNTAILAGLAVGDTVVTDGTDRLSDGAKISISAANAAPGSPAPAAQPAAAGKKKKRSGGSAPAAGAPAGG
jgi:multidrug efflux system membrane fusion protein